MVASYDEYEAMMSRQLTYWMRIGKNIRDTAITHHTLKKTRKDWMMSPEYLAVNDLYPKWFSELPQDFQITYPEDGSPPWLPSLYVAHMHCYHYLGEVMQYRPQIAYLIEAGDPTWQKHIVLCFNAAKNMCRLQEAILQDHGISGLLFVQRGISFTIYLVLTCIMLHLVSRSNIKRITCAYLANTCRLH